MFNWLFYEGIVAIRPNEIPIFEKNGNKNTNVSLVLKTNIQI